MLQRLWCSHFEFLCKFTRCTQTESFTLETHDANLEEKLVGATVRKYSAGHWLSGVVSGFTPRLPDPQRVQRADARSDALEATASASAAAAAAAAAAAPVSSPAVTKSHQTSAPESRKRKPSQKQVEATAEKAEAAASKVRRVDAASRTTAVAAVAAPAEAVPPSAAGSAPTSAPRQNGNWTVCWDDDHTQQLVGAMELQAELCQQKSRQVLRRTREYYGVMHARARS